MGRPRTGWSLRPPRGKNASYFIRFTDRAGSQRELTTGESDPVKAAERAAEIYARELTAAPVAGSRVSPHLALDEHLSMWLAGLETTHDPRTVETYTAYARAFVAFFGDSLARVAVPRMGDYQRKRLGEVTRKTLLKERSAMNGFLGWCVEQGVLAEEHRPVWPRLPKRALGVRSGAQRETPVDITPDQANAFLAALPQWSRARRGHIFAIRARFVVAYETGLRPATLDTLELPKHWRPGLREIEIENQHDKARFGRRIPISERCADALERTVRTLGITSGLIFGEHDYRAAVERARKATGLPETFAPYDLRHGRAGHLLDAGATMRAVAHLLGHRRLTTTDRYLRAQENDARAAIEAASFRGESGANDVDDGASNEAAMASVGNRCAKEGSRTPTRVTPPEPESGEYTQNPGKTEGGLGQEVPENADPGQGFRVRPKTLPPNSVPESVTSAAHYLALLRADWSAYDLLAISSDDDDGDAS